MKEKISRKTLLLMIFVAIPVVIQTVLYVIIAIKGIGTFGVGNYVSIVLNVIMYVSILRYAVDYFIKGKDVSLDQLIFKFGAATLGTLLGAQGGSEISFTLKAIMVFIVPYISASLNITEKNNKTTLKVAVLALAVWIISVVLAVLYIRNPVENYVSHMGRTIYILDAANQAIQWTLFAVLGFVRGIRDKVWIRTEQ